MHVTSSTSFSFRHEKDNTILLNQNSDFLIQQSFWDFLSFTNKMKNAVFPLIHNVYSASSIQFYFVKTDDNYKVAPELAVSEIILCKLQIKAFVFSNLILKDQYTVCINFNVVLCRK